MDKSGLKIITGFDPSDAKAHQLIDDAIAAAPADFVRIDAAGNITTNDTVAMLSRDALRGRCRLCGKEADLTKEHIPPKSSGNKGRHQNRSLDEWLKSGLVDDPAAKRKTEQGGIYGYTLCQPCNSLTGTLYGGEYKDWTGRALSVINGFDRSTIPQLDQMIGPFGWNVKFGSQESGSVKPGAMVRQVLSCMCSLSGPWDLAGRYPEIRRIVLDQSTEPLPQHIELGMSLYVGPNARIGGPQLQGNITTGVWRWCQEIAFPPFAFLLVIASNIDDAGLGLMMGDWSLFGPTEERYFEGVAELGFGWTPYPGDYRSRTAIATEAAQRMNPPQAV